MEHRDSLSSELDAMAVIGRVLEGIPDEDARQRVLRWACERFAIDSIPEALLGEGVMPAIAAANDPALQLESLDDMFETGSRDRDDLVVVDPVSAAAEPAKQPVETVLRSFVAEFQRFAEEWSGATA